VLQSPLPAEGGEEALKCRACDQEAAGAYCELHERAYRGLKERYEAWRQALGISWAEYLAEVTKNENTGTWAKEVAEALLSGDES